MAKRNKKAALWFKKKKEKKEDLCFVGFSFVSKPRYLQIVFWILELTKNNWYCNIKPWCQRRWNNVLNAQPCLRMRFCFSVAVLEKDCSGSYQSFSSNNEHFENIQN